MYTPLCEPGFQECVWVLPVWVLRGRFARSQLLHALRIQTHPQNPDLQNPNGFCKVPCMPRRAAVSSGNSHARLSRIRSRAFWRPARRTASRCRSMERNRVARCSIGSGEESAAARRTAAKASKSKLRAQLGEAPLERNPADRPVPCRQYNLGESITLHYILCPSVWCRHPRRSPIAMSRPSAGPGR